MLNTHTSLFAMALMAFGVFAKPIYSQPEPVQTTFVEWPFVDEYAIRNQVLDFYENIVEEVFTAHTQEILEHLQTNQRAFFGAGHSALEEPHASCIHKIENAVSNNVQAMSQFVYDSIEKHVDENLILLDVFNRNSEAVDPETSAQDIAALVYSLNQIVSYRLMVSAEEFNLARSIENDSAPCDLYSFFKTPAVVEDYQSAGFPGSLVHSKGLWLQSAKIAIDRSTGCLEDPIDYHVKSIQSDVLYEIEGRSMDIVNILYDSQFEDL
ncbi:hypothetical protein CLU79DRAFT_763142, partial [Phycomyces nitens]